MGIRTEGFAALALRPGVARIYRVDGLEQA